MRVDDGRARFHATIGPGGTVIVPAEAGARFRPGQAVEVTIAPAPGRGGRRGIGIDEEEVAWIAALQAEPASVVRKCLEAQGALAGGASRGRAARGKRASGPAGRGERSR